MIDLSADFVGQGWVNLVNESPPLAYDEDELQVYHILSELKQYKLQKSRSAIHLIISVNNIFSDYDYP